jgi:hypothetical protein
MRGAARATRCCSRPSRRNSAASLKRPSLAHEARIRLGHQTWQQRRIAPRDRQQARVDAGNRPELPRRNPAAEAYVPPWRPDGGQQRGRGHGGALARHFPLNDHVGALQARVGIVEQTTKDIGRSAEGQRTRDAKGFVRQRELEKVALDDLEMRSAAGPLPQAPRLGGIRFHRHDAHAAARKRKGDGAEPGANLDDQLTRVEIRRSDQAFSGCGIKKVLAEMAPPPVPGCPPMGGHGRSP